MRKERVAFTLAVTLVLAGGCGRKSGSGTASQSSSGAPGASSKGDDARLAVAVDDRVELMSILFRLAGLPRYTEATTPYARAVDKHFAAVRDHRAVTFTAQFGANFQFGYEMAPRLGVYLDEKLQPRAPLTPLPFELTRWKSANLEIYLAAVRDFAKEGHLDDFLAGQRKYFQQVEASDRALFDEVPIVEWYDAAFGRRAKARYHLVPGLLTGPMDYSARAQLASEGEDLYVVAHLDAPDAAGVPKPRQGALPFVAHELCHAYTNAIVDAAMDRLEPVAARTLDAAAGKMNAQAYTTHAIVLEESVVRATVVLWVRDRKGKGGDAEIGEQEQLGFVWTRALADALDAVRNAHDGALPAEDVIRATIAVFEKQ